MLRANLGWGNLPEHLAAADLRAGALVAIRPESWAEEASKVTLYAIHRSVSFAKTRLLCESIAVVLNDRHLLRLLRDYVTYYHDDRSHLALAKATPMSRPRQARPVGDAEVIALPRLGGLHHRYEWRAAA